ncbi:hypothetical protein TNCV_3401311 [Trichonephila clavipes]|nr:hypothetical protein TNCV_3401311 [Trichonephila clavipes]
MAVSNCSTRESAAICCMVFRCPEDFRELGCQTAVLHKELESIDSSVLYLVLRLAWCCDLVFDGGRGFRNRIQWGGRWLAWRSESANEMDDGRRIAPSSMPLFRLLPPEHPLFKSHHVEHIFKAINSALNRGLEFLLHRTAFAHLCS